MSNVKKLIYFLFLFFIVISFNTIPAIHVDTHNSWGCYNKQDEWPTYIIVSDYYHPEKYTSKETETRKKNNWSAHFDLPNNIADDRLSIKLIRKFRTKKTIYKEIITTPISKDSNIQVDFMDPNDYINIHYNVYEENINCTWLPPEIKTRQNYWVV